MAIKLSQPTTGSQAPAKAGLFQDSVDADPADTPPPTNPAVFQDEATTTNS